MFETGVVAVVVVVVVVEVVATMEEREMENKYRPVNQNYQMSIGR